MLKLFLRAPLRISSAARAALYHSQRKISRFTATRRMADDNQKLIAQNLDTLELPALTLETSETPAPPLPAIDQSTISKQWSFQPPFGLRPELVVPVYNFFDGEFSGENIRLRSDMFNLPLRRDIVHNVNQHYRMHDYRITKLLKTKGDVAGSGKKPFAQKGRGMARQGNLRATGRKKGGKPHGPVPREMSFPVNKKLKWLALKTILSARLYEDSLFFINSESIELPEPRLLSAILEPYQHEQILIVTGLYTDADFLTAAEQIPNLQHISAIFLKTDDLVHNSKIFITKEGLQTLELILDSQEQNYFRIRRIPRSPLPTDTLFKKEKSTMIDQLAKEIDYDETQPLGLVSESLREYLEKELGE